MLFLLALSLLQNPQARDTVSDPTACVRRRPLSAQAAVQKADLVFLGRVVSVEARTMPLAYRYVEPQPEVTLQVATIEAIRVWKGSPGGPQTVETFPVSDPRSVRFVVGEEYLVFGSSPSGIIAATGKRAGRYLPGEIVLTGKCDGTRRAARNDRFVRALGPSRVQARR